jgi:hypothetical protein
MPDAQFTYFATHEVGDLMPDAVEVLRQVMKERGTVPDPDAVIDVQRRRLSSEEFERMVTRFRELPCPMCGVSGGLLNGAPLNRGSSELIVGCRSCLEQQLKSANKASVLALFLKPATALTAISRNDAALRELESGKQTQALREYIWLNRGEWAHLLK